MSGAVAYLILAAEVAAGLAVLGVHAVRHHGAYAVLAAAFTRRPLPPPTPHEAWERDRLSPPRRRASWLIAVALDAGGGLAWVTGHRVPVLIAFGAAVAVVAISQPLAVRASRRAARP